MSEEQMAIMFPDMYGEEDPIYDMFIGYWCTPSGYQGRRNFL